MLDPAVKGGVVIGGSMLGFIVANAKFSSTINLGALIVAGLIIIASGFFALRDRLAKQQIEGWRGNYEAMKVRADETEAELKESLLLISEQKLVIQRLEALPNLERIVKLMADSADRMLEHTEELHRQNISIRAAQHQELMTQHGEIMREIRKLPTPLT